jgi:hypothetical protein
MSITGCSLALDRKAVQIVLRPNSVVKQGCSLLPAFSDGRYADIMEIPATGI